MMMAMMMILPCYGADDEVFLVFLYNGFSALGISHDIMGWVGLVGLVL